MAQKNDERIMELKKTIENKRKELASKPTRFNPVTNCLLVLDKVTYNLFSIVFFRRKSLS